MHSPDSTSALLSSGQRVPRGAGGKIPPLMSGRLWILVLCICIVAAVAGLASSLHDVRFQPGRPFAMEGQSATIPSLTITETITKPPLWKVLLFWLAFVINLILFVYLLPPDVRKRILRQMLSLAVGMLAILMALRYRLIQLPSFEGEPAQQGTGNATATSGAGAPPVFTPPHITAWLTFLISFAVLSIVLLLSWVAYRWWIRANRRGSSELDLLGSIAQASLGQIASGHDWGDVIIQSYVQMSEAVSRQRGLERSHAATPREFAERLEQAGLPAQAVQRLTRLFEAVRYGARTSSQSDVSEAVACLNSILQACGLTQ
jgi:uncharacterized protein DUF4129